MKKPDVITLVTPTKAPPMGMSVQGTFNYAMKKAREQGWTRVVIMGENGRDDTGKTVSSRMTKNNTIASLSKALHVLLRDSCDG